MGKCSKTLFRDFTFFYSHTELKLLYRKICKHSVVKVGFKLGVLLFVSFYSLHLCVLLFGPSIVYISHIVKSSYPRPPADKLVAWSGSFRNFKRMEAVSKLKHLHMHYGSTYFLSLAMWPPLSVFSLLTNITITASIQLKLPSILHSHSCAFTQEEIDGLLM